MLPNLRYGRIRCPECNKDIYGTLKYRIKTEKWYKLGQVLEFCPECETQLVTIENKKIKIIRLLFFLLILGVLFAPRPYNYIPLAVAIVMLLASWKMGLSTKYIAGSKRYSNFLSKIVDKD